MRLRYTGPVTTEFYDGERSLGEVAPGGEFDVPDELAERFTRRGDIEEVAAPARRAATDTSGAAATGSPAAS